MNFPQNTLPLQNLESDGQSPKARIQDAADAQSLVALLIDANRERSRVNAKVKGQIDGNAPYNFEKLKNAGQAWRANINFREAKSAVSAALVPYYDLFAGATVYWQIQTDYGDVNDQSYFSGVITEESDRTLKEYAGFDFNVHQMLYSFIGFGRGFLFWPDKDDWKFNCIPHSQILVPDGTESDVDKLECMVIRKSERVDKLFAKIKDRKMATDAGWNIDPTVNAIAKAYPKNYMGVDQYDYEFLQQQLKDKDLTEGTRCATVQMAHVFVKEFDGKISHSIVPESDISTMQQGSSGATGPKQAVQYLFQDLKAYDSFRQVLAAFFFETLDGSWNGATGLGHEIYSMMAMKDRLKCSAVDLTFLRTGITLKAKTQNAFERTSLIQAGALNIIPPDYDVEQAAVLGDVKGAVETDEYLTSVVVANTGIYRRARKENGGNPITATEAQIDQTNESVLSNSTVNRFYSSLDKCFKETFDRLVRSEDQDAKDFRARCKERGVPDEALKKIKSVRAYRNMGNGSLYMRKQAMLEMLQFYPMLPEGGKQNYLEDVIAAIAGHSMVERYAPRAERKKLPSDQQELAMLENAAMKIGAPVTWTPTQNNVIHAQFHLQAAAQALGSLQQGADKNEVHAYVDALGHHTAIHLEKLKDDPTRKNEYKALSEQFNQLAKANDQLAKILQQDAADQKANAAKTAQAQAIQSGTDADTQIKAAQVANKIKLDTIKAAAQMKNKDRAARQKLAINDAMSAAKIMAPSNSK